MAVVPIILSDYDYADMGLLDVGATGDLGLSFKRPKVKIPKVVKNVASEYKRVAEAAKARNLPTAKRLVAKTPLAKAVNSAQFKKTWKAAKSAANTVVAKVKAAAKVVAKKTSIGTDLVKKATNKAGAVIKDIKDRGIKKVAVSAAKKLAATIASKAKSVLAAAKKASGAAKAALTKKYNNLKNQLSGALDMAKKAAAGVAALGKKIAAGTAAVKSALASGMSKLGGKIKDIAKSLGSKIASVARSVANKVKESAARIAAKISSAVQNLKGEISAVKNAMLGEMSAMKAELTNMVSAGFSKIRSEMASLSSAMSAKIASLQEFVGKTIKEQGKRLAEFAAQNKQYFLELRTGQKDMVASTKELVEAKTDDIINQFNESFSHARSRFNQMDVALNRANEERNIIRNDVVAAKSAIMSQQERDKIILSAKIKGAETKLTKKVDTASKISTAGLVVSIAGALGLGLMVLI